MAASRGEGVEVSTNADLVVTKVKELAHRDGIDVRVSVSTWLATQIKVKTKEGKLLICPQARNMVLERRRPGVRCAGLEGLRQELRVWMGDELE